jgi:hypothetical protein
LNNIPLIKNQLIEILTKKTFYSLGIITKRGPLVNRVDNLSLSAQSQIISALIQFKLNYKRIYYQTPTERLRNPSATERLLARHY